MQNGVSLMILEFRIVKVKLLLSHTKVSFSFLPILTNPNRNSKIQVGPNGQNG